MSEPWWYPDKNVLSECCDAPILGETWEGFGICSQCKEMSPVYNVNDENTEA